MSAGESSDYEKARIGLAEAQELDAQDVADVELARRRAELAAAIGTPLDPATRLVGTLAMTTPAGRAVENGTERLIVEDVEALAPAPAAKKPAHSHGAGDHGHGHGTGGHSHDH